MSTAQEYESAEKFDVLFFHPSAGQQAMQHIRLLDRAERIARRKKWGIKVHKLPYAALPGGGELGEGYLVIRDFFGAQEVCQNWMDVSKIAKFVNPVMLHSKRKTVLLLGANLAEGEVERLMQTEQADADRAAFEASEADIEKYGFHSSKWEQETGQAPQSGPKPQPLIDVNGLSERYRRASQVLMGIPPIDESTPAGKQLAGDVAALGFLSQKHQIPSPIEFGHLMGETAQPAPAQAQPNPEDAPAFELAPEPFNWLEILKVHAESMAGVVVRRERKAS